jgi:hypothetical protein
VGKPPHSPASLSASLSSFSRPYALSLVSVIPNGSLPISGSYPLLCCRRASVCRDRPGFSCLALLRLASDWCTTEPCLEGLRKIVCVSGPKVVTPWCGVSEWLGDSKDIKKADAGHRLIKVLDTQRICLSTRSALTRVILRIRR